MCETVLQMGCDIFSWAEIYVPEVERWKTVEHAFAADAFEREHDHLEFVSTPFRNRNYGLFGFRAGVRNYARCEPLAQPRGLPAGCDAAGGCRVNNIDSLDDFPPHSWFLVSDFWRSTMIVSSGTDGFTRGNDGAALAQEGEGVHQTYREFLG